MKMILPWVRKFGSFFLVPCLLLASLLLLYFFPVFYNPEQANAVNHPCPVTDGGVGDGDSTVDGTITLNADTSWAADGVSGTFDCTGLSIHVTNNATLTLVSYDNGDTNWTNDYGVTVLTDNMIVDAGSSISADGKGYPVSEGPGAGADHVAAWSGGGGGAHGGYAGGGNKGALPGSPNGDVFQPTNLGSGGGYGDQGWGTAAGGGAIKLVISNTLTLDGEIRSTGSNTSASVGGGSGGSIWIDTQTLSSSGSGVVRVNGASGSGGRGGSGSAGRIALYYTTNSGFSLDGVQLKAYGATAQAWGGPGTVYVEHVGVDTSQQGTLLVDDNTNNGKAAVLLEASYQFSLVNLTRYGHLDILGNGSGLTVTSSPILTGDSTAKLTVYGTITYSGSQPFALNGLVLHAKGKLAGVTDINIGSSPAAELVIYANTWFYAGTHTYGDITVGPNGMLTLASYDNEDTNWTNDYGLTLSVDNLTVDSGGVVSANKLGYPESEGPGAGADHVAAFSGGAGGGHGGYAVNGNKGADGGDPNGDVFQPTNLGSGGGYGDQWSGGGKGGGAVKLNVSDTFSLDGTLTSNGGSGTGRGAGGAGGSIWIDTDIVTGSGTVAANGGDGTSGGGGSGSGGRIALYYTTNSGFTLDSDHLYAYGGDSPNIGGPGTVYIEHDGVDPVTNGDLIVDNNNKNGLHAGLLEASYDFKSITLTRYGHLDILGQGSTLTIGLSNELSGDSTTPYLDAYGTYVYTGPQPYSINGAIVRIMGKLIGVTDLDIGSSPPGGLWIYANTWFYAGTHTYGDITVGPNGTLTLVSYDDGDTDWTDDYGLTLDVDNLTVDAGGVVTANGKGYPESEGPGAGTDHVAAFSGGAGGAHGGYAWDGNKGVKAGDPNGDAYQPTNLGSGGGYGDQWSGGGKGGGAVKLNVSNTLSLDGTFKSNGANSWGSGGGGSGGSVWINTNVITGSGVIEANGGDASGWTTGTGSGGRIALYYTTNSGFTFDSDHLYAYGGDSPRFAGPGTIYIEHSGVDIVRRGIMIVDNNGNNGLHAALLGLDHHFKKVDLTGQGHLDVVGFTEIYSQATPENPSLIGPFPKDGRVALYFENFLGGAGVWITLTHNATTYATMDTSTFASVGAGLSYGVTDVVVSAGDFVQIYVEDQFQPEPPADPPPWPASGWASPGTGQASPDTDLCGWDPFGKADISDEKDYVDSTGEPRVSTQCWSDWDPIAEDFDANDRLIIFSYDPTDPSTTPGNGNLTVSSSPDLTGDNTTPDLSVFGTFTYLGSQPLTINGLDVVIRGEISGVTDLTLGNGIAGGMTLYANTWARSGSYTFGDIIINSSGTLGFVSYDNGDTNWTNDYGVTLNTDNLTVNTGGVVTASNFGYRVSEGPGAGTDHIAAFCGGGGGGYGGAGEDGNCGASAGATYGSALQPADLGSGGGYSDQSTGSGRGGGAMKLVNINTLVASGIIRSNGQNASGRGAAGSGGSVWIETGAFVDTACTGVVEAKGGLESGSHPSAYGGGGRIAIYHSSLYNYCGVIDCGPNGTCTTSALPAAPTSLTQYKSDGTTPISTGAWTNETTVVFKFQMGHGGTGINLTPEIEVEPVGTSFDGTPTHTGSPVMFTGTPVTGVVTASSLTDLTGYHWQARTCDGGVCSSWVSYGGNSESANDFRVDATPPDDPTNIQSTSHTVSSWSTDNTVDVTWTAAVDQVTGSGVDGYSYEWSTSPSTTPDATKDLEETATSHTSPTLTDGNAHWFHIRTKDNAGNWTSTAHFGPFWIDVTPPDDPTNVHSTSHTIAVWSTNDTIVIDWNSAFDATSGVDGYSILWDATPTSTPDNIKDLEENVTSVPTGLPDGNAHWFHIRTKDNAGNWTSTAHLGPFYIDTTDPSPPTSLLSTSHTTGVWSNDDTVDTSWTAGTDGGSGVAGYSVVWDDATPTLPDNTVEEAGTSHTSSALADDNDHYFYIRTVDNAGNTSTSVSIGAFWIDTNDLTNATDLSGDPPILTWSADNTVEVTWTAGTDSGSGVDGYSIFWDGSPSTTPDTTKDLEETATSIISLALIDGDSHWFHIRTRDNAGNWTTAAHLGPFYIDAATPPTTPGEPTTSSPTSDKTPSWSWTASTDIGSGLGDPAYTIQWSQDPTFSSGVSTATSNTNSFTHSSALADGTWYIRVKATDAVGNASAYSDTGSTTVSTAPVEEEEEEEMSYTVTVKAEDEDGNPLEGVEVEIDGETGTTDENGEVVFEDLPAGDYTVSGTYEGQTVEEEVTLVGDEEEVDVTLVFTTGDEEEENYTLTVTAEDEDGNPLEGVEVTLGDDFTGTTDENGEVVFEDVPAGGYLLSGEYEGEVVEQTLNLTGEEREVEATLVFSLGEPSLIEWVGEVLSDFVETVSAAAQSLSESVKVAAGATSKALAPIAIAGLWLQSGLLLKDLPLLFHPNLLWSLLLALFGVKKKKRRAWGIVYDSLSKQPLIRAMVKLVDKAGKTVDFEVTDKEGIFSFLPEEGVYTLEVARAGYDFPSKTVTGSKDGEYENIYRGEDISITKDQPTLSFSIPLDPHEVSGLTRLRSFFRRRGSTANILLLLTSLGVSLLSYLSIPTTLNQIVTFLYIGLLALIVGHTIRIGATWGQAKDEKGKVVSGLALSLVNAQTGQSIKRRVTNIRGQYQFATSQGDYKILIASVDWERVPGAKGYQGEEIKAAKKTQLINPPITVRKKPEEALKRREVL